jgi:hypothetical protein
MCVKILIITPTRGDRPVMLDNMQRMMSNQTLNPYGSIIVDDAPTCALDLTYRYRTGISRGLAQYPDAELIAFIEDDDWYDTEYLETYAKYWVNAGMPDLMGQAYTYYYHLGLRAIHYQSHPNRSSAFTTFASPRIFKEIRWPDDKYSFLDLEIWKQFSGKTIDPGRPLAVGIKGHDEGGVFGGIGHNSRWSAYGKWKDPELEWLKSTVDAESFEFYKKISDEKAGNFV